MWSSRRLAGDARAVFDAALRSVQADALIGRVRWEAWLERSLEAYARVVVLGMGKAALAMAGVVEAQLGRRVEGGAVVVPAGHPRTLPERFPRPRRIEVWEGAHPIPDERSARAARRLLHLAAEAGPDDLVLVLLSGGGTALAADAAPGVPLAAAQRTFRLLLDAGADIHAMNTVRKHLTRVGGGQLARAAAPAAVLALAVSDVVGDDCSVIASGPTVPDPTTFAEAVDVLRRFRLWERVPAAVRAHLGRGADGRVPETPKPGDGAFTRARTELIGTNRDALAGAVAAAEARGYVPYVLGRAVTGEARDVAKRLVREVQALEVRQPACLLWGGETTVTVRGRGRGGRNQELALAAALALDGLRRPLVFLSAGTDGRDGPTDAAGAWVTPQTVAEARARGLLPEQYLAANDAYAFFDRLGRLIRTGPTHTNVMDLQLALLGPPGDGMGG